MATVNIPVHPRSSVAGAADGARPDVIIGTNFPIPALSFAGGTTDEHGYWTFRAVSYGSGNLTLDIDWYAETASSGVVRWGTQIAAITPNDDTQDIETKAFDTATEVNDTHLGTTDQRLHRATLTITNLDSLAKDDWFVLHIYREASDTGNDTMAGVALMVLSNLSYSDT